jgi:hypothetical protein
VRHEGQDVQVDALQASRRTLEVAVVDGQHHGSAALWAEDPRQAVLHTPVVRARALQEEGLEMLWDLLVELFAAAAAVGFRHRSAHLSS